MDADWGPVPAAARLLQRRSPGFVVTLRTFDGPVDAAEVFGDPLDVRSLSHGVDADQAAQGALIDGLADLLHTASGRVLGARPLAVYVAEELASIGDFGVELTQVTLADGALHLLCQDLDQTLLMSVMPMAGDFDVHAAGLDEALRLSVTAAGVDDFDAHAADLATVLGALSPWNNAGDCLWFESAVVSHGLAAPADGPVRDWLSSVRPWQGLDAAANWEDTEHDPDGVEPEPLDAATLAEVLAEVERAAAESAITTYDLGWEEPAGRDWLVAADARRRELGGALVRDLFDIVRRRVGTPLLAYRIGLPTPLRFGEPEAAGLLVLIGPEHAGLVAVDGAV
jgi:hypothetical protein